MGLTTLIIIVATFGQVSTDHGYFYDLSSPNTQIVNRLEGLDKAALEERGKGIAKLRDGLRSLVVQDLMVFAENELGLSPPYKSAEVAVFTEIADEVCKPVDRLKARTLFKELADYADSKRVNALPAPTQPKVVVYRAGFRTVDINGVPSTVWAKPDPNDPSKGIYAIEDQPLEIRMRMRGEAPLPIQYVSTSRPVVLTQPVTSYTLPPISFASGGCADGSCAPAGFSMMRTRIRSRSFCVGGNCGN